jgi:hypothetical protein
VVAKLKRDSHQAARRALGPEIRSLGLLTSKLAQSGFGIKKIALKRTSIHEQMDNTLGLGRKIHLSATGGLRQQIR